VGLLFGGPPAGGYASPGGANELMGRRRCDGLQAAALA
jgi:hypothetical protein